MKPLNGNGVLEDFEVLNHTSFEELSTFGFQGEGRTGIYEFLLFEVNKAFS